MKKILITGGTGFVGKALAAQLREKGFEPVIFSRNAGKKPGDAIGVDAEELIPTEVLSTLYGIVNLAGENIGQKWTPEVKERILNSRIDITDRIAAALRRNIRLGLPVPSVLVNASAVGYYGSHPSGIQTEDSPGGQGFLASVCRQWEQSAKAALEAGVRVVIFRFGIVLGPDGGILTQMARPFKWKVGGVVGSGRQYISWVHRKDLICAISLALEHSDMSGAYNLTSPNPIRMDQFTRFLGKELGSPSWTKVPDFLVKLVFGEMAEEMLLADQQVYPKRLLEAGFVFSFPELPLALADIYQKR